MIMDRRVEPDISANQGALLLYVDDKRVGEIEFLLSQPDKMIITHTGVDKAFGGQGYARYLVEEAVKYAESKGLKLSSTCYYASAVLAKR